MKLKVRQHCYRKVRKVLESGLNGENTVKVINTWTFAAVRYTAYIMDYNSDEVKLWVEKLES